MAVLMYVGWNGYAKADAKVEYCRDSFESRTKAYKKAIEFIENFEKEYLDDKYYEYGHLDISGSMIIQWIFERDTENGYPVYIEIC